MRNTLFTGLVVGLLTIVMAVPALASNGKSADSSGRPGSTVQVTVLSTGLTYDSIVKTELPMKGPFQELVIGANGLETAYGPGERGFVGGRWWIDVTGDGEMNEGDAFFLCPLLGPGQSAG